ncbi:MAG: hypothetical protein ACRD96_16310, partial [Bryobacteraceae bacterium]
LNKGIDLDSTPLTSGATIMMVSSRKVAEGDPSESGPADSYKTSWSILGRDRCRDRDFQSEARLPEPQ